MAPGETELPTNWFGVAARFCSRLQPDNTFQASKIQIIQPTVHPQFDICAM